MQKSYTKNYIKIYIYQILSIVLGFVSLFVVIPYLSSDKTTYGVYTVCISISIFLSYADLGFLSAGMKFAAESFSRNELEDEIKIIGFTHLILLIFVGLISCLFFYLSFHPSILIHDIVVNNQYLIAKNLLLILALFSPTIVLQRMVQTIFAIRLKDYIVQQINIIGNVLKISSVYYFFNFLHYDIVGYFLFVQIVNLCCIIYSMYNANKLFKYDFLVVFKNMRFNKKIFDITKHLAFSGLFVTISWILYYELDSFAIGKLLGSNQVATFAIGLTLLSFFRSLLGAFFSPFSSRFNHFVGENKITELRGFYLHVIKISFPIVVFPIISVLLFAKPIIISWVGPEYEQSIEITRWLVACNVLAFISYPAGMLMTAQQQLKKTYIIGVIMPIIYWSGILLTYKIYGVKVFAIFKAISFLISGVIYFAFSISFLKISIFTFFREEILPYIPSIIFIVITLFILNNLFVNVKNKQLLLINGAIIGFTILVAFLISIIFVKSLRVYFFKLIKSIKPESIEIQ